MARELGVNEVEIYRCQTRNHAMGVRGASRLIELQRAP
jgi:hypothetical protein